MATVSTSEPRFQQAFHSCVSALRRVAEYRLDPAINEHLRELSERKEFLGSGEHAELLALVRFTQQRSIEKLEAEVALRQLKELFPELVKGA